MLLSKPESRNCKFSHGNNGSVSSFESAMSGLELSPDSNFKTKEPMTNNKEEVQPANNDNIEDADTASMSDKVILPNVKNVLLVSKQKDSAKSQSKGSSAAVIPHICHFFYTGRIFENQILHPKKQLKTPKTLKISLKKSNVCSFFTQSGKIYT